jgi:hypothetical protein
MVYSSALRLFPCSPRAYYLLGVELLLNTLFFSSAQSQIEMEVTKVKADVDVYVRTTQDQFSMENSFMIYQLAGTFTLLGGLISMWHMTAHLRRFNQPFVQVIYHRVVLGS